MAFDPDQYIAKSSQSSAAPQVAAPGSQQQQGSKWYQPVRSALQGATFGFSDEIGAGIASVPAMVATGQSWRDLPDIYSDIHEALGKERKQYQKDNAALSTGLEIAGALPAGIASGAKVLGSKVAQNVPKWLSAAGIGGAEGALYGAGTADQGERTEGAAIGGALGAVAAPVVGAAAGAIGNIVGPIAKSFAERMKYTPKAQAIDVLRKTAEDAGLTVDDIVNQYQKLGPEGVVADTDESFRMLMRALSDRSGSAKRSAREVLEGRQNKSVDRLISQIQSASGKNAREFSETLNNIKTERSATASPLYDESWSSPVSPAMADLVQSRPSLKIAMEQGLRMAADEGENVGRSSFKQFHYAKMALDDQIGRAIRSGDNNKARILTKTKNDLLAQMDATAPSYKQARDLYAGDSELINAAVEGQKLLKSRPDEIEAFVQSMGSSEKEMFKHGAIKSIVDMLEDSQITSDNARKLINSKTMLRKLATVFDSPDEMNNFVNQAVREREFSRTRQVVSGGSPTSQNLQAQKSLESDAMQAFSILGDAKTGFISTFLQAIKGKPITPETIDEAARVLLSKGMSEDDIRKVFTRSKIIQEAINMAPGARNAAIGSIVPVAGAVYER